MSCNCKNKVAVLICPECSTIQTMSYQKGENPPEVLEKKQTKCLKCRGLMELKDVI